jgi:hypothetical protein
MQCIAPSVVFTAVEMCSNNLPSRNGTFRVAMGICPAKPHPADGQIAAFRDHVTVSFNVLSRVGGTHDEMTGSSLDD